MITDANGKKLDEVTQQNYAPTNLVRWLPLVGPVINYWSPRTDKDTQAASMTGQSFDLRKKELNVIRYSYENKPPSASSNSTTSTPVQTPTHAERESPQSSLALTLSDSTNALTPTQPQTPTSSAPALTQSSALSSTVSAPAHTREAASHPAAGGASPGKAHSGSKEHPPPQSPASLSSRSSRSHTGKSSVTVTFDDQERAILKHPFAHKSLAEVIDYLSKGVVLTSHFPADEVTGTKASDVMVADLLIFYVSHYTGDADESLGRGPILAWCEPTERYVSAEQAVAIEHITELHLGKSNTFPQSSDTSSQQPPANELCLSLVTPQVALFLHAHNKSLRDDFFLALYILLGAHHTIIKTDRTTKPAKAHKRAISAAEQQTMKPSGTAQAADMDVSASPEGSNVVVKDVHQALSILTAGMPFIVYVLDKQDVEISTRHEITLWFKPEATTPAGASPTATSASTSSTGTQAASQSTGKLLGYLCWCKRGAPLVYSSSQSLPISSTVQICLGRQTKALRNEAARSAAGDRCFSIMVDKMILNLEALSNDARSLWLACFHKIMINAGKTRVYEEQLRQRATPSSQIQVVT